MEIVIFNVFNIRNHLYTNFSIYIISVLYDYDFKGRIRVSLRSVAR